jgi:hypothetical protein
MRHSFLYVKAPNRSTGGNPHLPVLISRRFVGYRLIAMRVSPNTTTNQHPVEILVRKAKILMLLKSCLLYEHVNFYTLARGPLLPYFNLDFHNSSNYLKPHILLIANQFLVGLFDRISYFNPGH